MLLSVMSLLAEGAAQGGDPPPWFQFLPMIAIAVTAYLLLILPMRRERRQRMEMVSAIKKGDRVVIQNAVLGTVAQEPKPGDSGESELLVKIDDGNVKLRVLLSAVTRVIPDKKDSKDGA
ncbi:MAG: preprotein translocase subunit YajC [Gemmataceae bacterium]